MKHLKSYIVLFALIILTGCSSSVRFASDKNPPKAKPKNITERKRKTEIKKKETIADKELEESTFFDPSEDDYYEEAEPVKSEFTPTGESFSGKASYYADKFHGRKTASGEIYNMHKMTCAHRKLAFGTILRVTNLHNNKQVIVKVTDRGPFKGGRVIDLSYAAAKALDMIRMGIINVEVEIMGKQ